MNGKVYVILIKNIIMIIRCACDCNQELEELDDRKRIRKFIKGHNNKGKSNYWKIKEKVKVRTSRERASKILKRMGITKCQINNKDCKGRLESHHIDKNPFNNDISNLNLLCKSHHKFADLRNLSLIELQSLNLEYTISRSNNQRRYVNKT